MAMFGCDFDLESLPIKGDEALGRYDAEFGYAPVNYFILNSDSTYVKFYMGRDSVLYQDTGRWEIKASKVDGSYKLVLSDFIPRFRENRKKEQMLAMSYEYGADTTQRFGLLKKDFNGITFQYCYDARQYYRKQVKIERKAKDN